jgi:ribosome-associated translation inhibitor RaiA
MCEDAQLDERSEELMNGSPPMEVTVLKGEIPPSVSGQARRKVGAVLHLAPAPVLSARVTLAFEAAPDIERPAVAKATLDVNGHPIRAHVAGRTLSEAIDLLEAKLRRELEILSERRRSRRHAPAEAAGGSWQHGMLPAPRPPWFPRPVDERELVSTTSLLGEQTVAEAAEDLELLGHDWVLFTERTTGADALLERTDNGFRLSLTTDVSAPSAQLDLPVDVQGEVPRMELTTALDLLAEIGGPLVLFVDAATGRGRVVYRRYDGHYGTLACRDDRARRSSSPPDNRRTHGT